MLQPLHALRARPTWVFVHRWIGLAMTLFLVVAGLTGSLIAFYAELDALLNPQLHRIERPAPDARMLDAVALLENVLEKHPDLTTDSALAPYQPDAPLVLWMEPRDPNSSPIDGEIYVNPYTGEILGSRRWGDISQGLTNLMPFIYRLHYSLALGNVGVWIFGIVALLWTLDCFLGAYLTLPRGRPFLQKWRPAWKIKPARFNFDLHRASGLWTWAMLFVLAWSSVALNLGEQIYAPVTRAVLGMTPPSQLPPRPEQQAPALSWRPAYLRGQALMREALAQRDIRVWREDALRYDHHRSEYNYWIATKFRNHGEPCDWFGVTFDADTGELLRVNEEDIEPHRERAGDWFTRWIVDLHMARVWGLPYRIFVCAMGLVVTALSVTGAIIWWRKRRARAHAAGRSRRLA